MHTYIHVSSANNTKKGKCCVSLAKLLCLQSKTLCRNRCSSYQRADSWAVLRRTSARPRHTRTSVMDDKAAEHMYMIHADAITWPGKPICPLSLLGWWTTVKLMMGSEGAAALTNSDQMMQTEARESKDSCVGYYVGAIEVARVGGEVSFEERELRKPADF
jgi:hypothetical protein